MNNLDYFGDEKELKRFTCSCNKMEIIGLNARHGKSKPDNLPAPKNTITDLSEAIVIILSLASNFCITYIEKIYNKKFYYKKFESDNSVKWKEKKFTWNE